MANQQFVGELLRELLAGGNIMSGYYTRSSVGPEFSSMGSVQPDNTQKNPFIPKTPALW